MQTFILQISNPLKNLNATIQRCISTSVALYGKRNIRKFLFPNNCSFQSDRERLRKNPELIDRRGVRPPGFWEGHELTLVPEMVPKLIVPDLTGFELKPYVSYKTADITQEPFNAEHLFYCAYLPKMKKDFEAGKLDEDGNPIEPSENEKMTSEEALQKSRKTGSDLFG